MDPVVLMAFADIRPIGEVDFSVASINQFDPSKPRVSRLKIVFPMMGDIGIAIAMNGFGVYSTSMEICSEKSIVKLFWPLVALVDHQSGVCVSTSGLIGAIGHFLVTSDRPMFFADVPVKVISGLVD